MNDATRFTVVIVGSAGTPCFNGLIWAESTELVRLSFKQGHKVEIWRLEG